MKAKYLLVVLMLLTTLYSKGQDSTWTSSPTLKFGAFFDTYYMHDLGNPQGKSRQPFLFSHNRHQEISINYAVFQMSVSHDKYHAKLALQGGTFASDNYAHEEIKNIYEANVGLSLNQKNTLWLDVGIMPSNLGFESAISSDNYTLTRSLTTESTPYYLSCAKLTYQIDPRWSVAAIVSNGWQRIQRVTGNSILSFGTQVDYKAEKVKAGWGTFVGTDDPDSTRRMKYYSSAFVEYLPHPKFSFILGLDYGIQQASKGSQDHITSIAPTLIAQYRPHQRWRMALRGEYMYDKDGLLVTTQTPNGFQTTGLSYNLDYLPNSSITCRVEARYFGSKDQIFWQDQTPSRHNFVIGTSIAIKLGHL